MKHTLAPVLSAVSIASFLALGAAPIPAHAASCGDGQIENGSFETPVLGDLVEADIIVINSWGAPPHRVWDFTNTPPVWAMVESLPSVDTAVSQAMVWSATEGAVEIQQHGTGGSVTASAGDQWAEITGVDVSNTLYQVVDSVPGTVMTWRITHRGLTGTDVMQVKMGATLETLEAQEATPDTGSGVADSTHISDGTSWRTWRGTYTVPEGQTSTIFGFHGVSSGGGDQTTGNLIDDIAFSCDAELTAEEEAGGGGSSSGGQDLAKTGLASNSVSGAVTTAAILGASAIALFAVRRRLRERRKD